jgi:hypothetical protein
VEHESSSRMVGRIVHQGLEGAALDAGIESWAI